MERIEDTFTLVTQRVCGSPLSTNQNPLGEMDDFIQEQHEKENVDLCSIWWKQVSYNLRNPEFVTRTLSAGMMIDIADFSIG